MNVFLTRSGLWLLLGLLFVTAGLAAQGRVSGLVAGPDDEPIAGAEVVVRPSEAGSDRELTAVTASDGTWAIAGLESGRWLVVVASEGYFPAEGWFRVSGDPTPTVVDVSLRSLAETSPSFAENSGTVLRWVEKGNALLAQGETAAARAEYEKALPVLARPQRPEVLQAIARTHFLEGDADAAIDRLEEGLTISPDSATLRELLTALLSSLGRGDEAPERIAAAERKAVEQQIPERAADGSAPGAPPSAPLVEATTGRTGRFRTRFDTRHPLSQVETYLERLDLDREELEEYDTQAGAYDLATESFELFVPELGGSSTDSYGVLVWVSPTPLGGFRNPDFERVLSERKLIWVGANDSGNQRRGWYRVGLALDAAHGVSRLYPVDPDRIYVAGYSGGGRISSSLAMLYSEVFRGGLFLYGADFYEQLPVPDKPGSFWPARFSRPSGAALEGLKSSSRFVLLTGDNDFNRSQTKAIYKRMEASGFEHLTYLQIPGADHYFGLPPEWLEQGLDALDTGAGWGSQ